MKKFKETEWFADLMFNILSSDDTWLKMYEEEIEKQTRETKKANIQKINISNNAQTQTKY